MAPQRRHLSGPFGFAALLLITLTLLTPLAPAHEVLGAAMFADAEPLLAPLVPGAAIRTDGVIGTSEYASLGKWRDPAEGVELLIEQDNGSLYTGIVNGYRGWAALGFGFALGEAGQVAPLDVVALSWNGTTSQVEERTIPDLTDEFTTVPANGTPRVLRFGAVNGSADTTYEVQLVMNETGASPVAVEPGSLVPFFVAFGNTTGSPPVNLSEGDVHLFRLYPLRPADDPLKIIELFFGTPPPGLVPASVAVGVIVVGLSGLAWRFVGRLRRGGK